MVRFAAHEQLCRSLQEKTRDLESQLAKEMKARLQHENRVAAASAKPSSSFSIFIPKSDSLDTEKSRHLDPPS
ncbi:hypothetical protein IFM89_039135 [Coptis chinensis]|uniref:Uncharacterized protein n=1 Tax=Coptis chinensis TaxID=261450 RepID=A0A835H1G9_9MAGN|nr:hypothetical protein IFM89_039135 [Coptis chinensis]